MCLVSKATPANPKGTGKEGLATVHVYNDVSCARILARPIMITFEILNVQCYQ